MKRFVIFLSSLIIIWLLSQSLFAQSTFPLLTYNEAIIVGGEATTSINRIRGENENYLETFFSPETIPTAGIPVLENAFGDIIKDSTINILDLLRLRDIIIGRAPTPTSYEMSEADLTIDGNLNTADLNAMRDILLGKKSIPYMIDSAGGKVMSDGITLTIPPGAVDSTIVISIKRNSESEFANDMGVDTKGAVEDSAYFMASFEITSSTLDFKLPVGATIKLDSIPPCAYQGLNGLFAAVPDRDGDGQSELFLINELQVDSDSLSLTAVDISVPLIQSLSSLALEPGQLLTVSGSGFGNDIENIIAEFQSVSTDSFQFVLPNFVDDSTIMLTTPGINSGQYHLIIHNVLTALISNPHTVEILPPGTVTGDIRSIIINFFTNMAIGMDSISTDTLVALIEDTTVSSYIGDLRHTFRTEIDSTIFFYNSLDDSLIADLEPLASFILNMTNGRELKNRHLQFHPENPMDCAPCKSYYDESDRIGEAIEYWTNEYDFYAVKCAKDKPLNICIFCEAAERARQRVLALTNTEADWVNLYNDCVCRRCSPVGCKGCEHSTFIGYGPQNQRVSGGYGPGGFGTKGCCINIIRYKRNQCASVSHPYRSQSPVPPEQLPQLVCPSNIPGTLLSENLLATSNNAHAHPGSIIKVTNAPVPYNIVGILNDNGKAFIPHVPMNTKVTFSMYDPVTGFYDPDVGTYTTGSTPGGFDRPILLFQPNTGIRQIAINIGDLKYDSISLDWQRIDYLLNIGPADTSKLLNIGFSSTVGLLLRIEDPDGIVLFANTNVSCYLQAHMHFMKIGRYCVRVALGINAQPGQFDLGVNVSPNQPLNSSCLCGDIVVDTLYEELSPYKISCLATVVSNDTLVPEAGTIMEFDEGGVITVNGAIRGIGSSLKPITLKQYRQTDRGESLSIGDKIKNGTQRRKEVQP